MAETITITGTKISGGLRVSPHLGSYNETIRAALTGMAASGTISRIWSLDHTVFKPEPDEISNRLGWLTIAERMLPEVPRMDALADSVRKSGYTHVVLCGMGGSSLAPEVLCRAFGVQDGFPGLLVLDSTDPDAILAIRKQIEPAKTLFIISTKSGGTVETLSFFKFFYNEVTEAVGSESAGAHFIAITDPGSSLTEVAKKYSFREIFLNDPDIGGRYSALSFFGMVPAALIGIDCRQLLDRAVAMATLCKNDNGLVEGDNPGALLGAIMGEMARAGRDKITILASPVIASLGDWVEQLVAESTGKEGTGILPVVGEPIGEPDVYSDDRLFIYMHLGPEEVVHPRAKAIKLSGRPLVCLHPDDLYDIGALFFMWEMATAVAGIRLGINPFDQPNVESAKILARDMVATYRSDGRLPELTPSLQDSNVSVYTDLIATSPGKALAAFLDQASPGAYISLQAYIQPTAEVDSLLRRLQGKLRDHTRLATTLGYGPRFLHSTGQLHKGDAGHGLFIQLTADSQSNCDIPDQAGAIESSMTFGVLKTAQALGDRQALLDTGRKVIRFHLGSDIVAGLNTLMDAT